MSVDVTRSPAEAPSLELVLKRNPVERLKREKGPLGMLAELPARGSPREAAIDPEPEADAEATPESSAAQDDHPLLRVIGRDTVSLEQLSQRSGWPQDELNATLLDLELDGLVARLPGALFQRRRRA